MVKDADGNFVMSRSSMIDISERKQAEAALWRSQEQLQFISDHAPVCIAHYDREQRYQFVNQRYAGMFGLHPADLIGKHMRDVLEEKIYVQASPHIEAVLTGQPVEFDITLGTTPDKFREIHVNYVPEYAASGRVAGFIAAIADITERKRAETVLRQHKRMIDTAVEGFWVTDARGNLLEANMAYAKMSGYSIEELVSMHISQVEAIETSAEQVQAHIAKIIAQGYDQFETRHRHKDGHEIDVEISTTYMADMERFIVFCHDITERKKAELEKLQDSDLRFRGTLEQVAVGFIHASLDGCFQQANQKFCEIIGYSSEELLQMNFRELTFSADAAREEEHLLQLLAGKISNFSREQRFVRKNLSLVWVNLTVSLLRKADGMPAFYICVVEDIAERKHAEVLAQQYGHLLQSSFDEIYLFDAHTLHFLLASEGAERNLGYSDDELRQLTPLDLKPSFSREDFEQRVAPLRSGERQSISFESDHRRKDGSTYLMEVRLQLMQADYPVFMAIIRDITERKRIEHELSGQKEFLRQVIDADPSLIFVKDIEGRLLLANQAMATIYGLPLNEMLGDKYLTHLKRQGSEAELYMEIDREVIQKQMSVSFAHTSSLGGKERWYLTTKTPITLSDGTVNLLGISVDITESKRAENELNQSRQLLRDLVVQSESLREKERKHIARELHDELGQILTALRMNTSLLRIEFGEHNATLREKINGITELLDQSIQCTRNVVTHLRPAALDMGIIPAVKWLTDDFIKLTGIPCTLSAPEDEIHLDEALAVSAFRVVQESLTNVARYAEASKVEIFLNQDADNFSVTVNDNGKGFDYMAISNHKSFGLLGMRERAIALGGVVNIYSAPQQGTQIFFVVPNQQATTTMKAAQS
jgi:PAS domain S-box-containing protein